MSYQVRVKVIRGGSSPRDRVIGPVLRSRKKAEAWATELRWAVWEAFPADRHFCRLTVRVVKLRKTKHKKGGV